MYITNLREKDVSELSEILEKLKYENPDIQVKVFQNQEEVSKDIERKEHQEMIESMNLLHKKVNRLLIRFGLAKENILLV